MAFDIGTVILQWQTFGIYDFLLPFLLVFAVVFGILTATNILGENKGLHVIIAIIIGLMSIGYNYSTSMSFSKFLQVVLPKMAIGLSIILVLLILIGLFIPDDERKYWGWGLGAIGVIIAIVIVSQTFDQFGWSATGYGDYAGWIIGAVLLLGLIIAVAVSSGEKAQTSGKPPKKGDGGFAVYTPIRGR